MSPTPEPAVDPDVEVYELRPLRERLLSGPRRWTLRVLLFLAWLIVINVVGWALQLGFANAMLVGGVGPLIGVVGLTLVQPNARRVLISDRHLVVSAGGPDQAFWWDEVSQLKVRKGGFINVHDFVIKHGPGVYDNVVVKADQTTWAELVARLTDAAEAHDVPVTTR